MMTRGRGGYPISVKHSYTRDSNLTQTMFSVQCLPRRMLGPAHVLVDVKFLGKTVQNCNCFLIGYQLCSANYV